MTPKEAEALIHALGDRLTHHVYPDGSEEYRLDGEVLMRLGPIQTRWVYSEDSSKLVITRAVAPRDSQTHA